MGIFDKAKDVLSQHPDKVEQGLDKAADLADRRTGGEHTDQIDRGVGVAQEKLGDFLRKDTPPA
ncbi:MT0933-like antitoxin protein [Friedmanniella luteola]|uniref:MT0933-like antitoxin protein n=1 Tax=Friedmanniella luteola TaxID=546871 RepID=A0A1H1RA06_9ACTN|nr:antitoxin [Friedmanniella luteola]SDS32533.1 MT0933-like antitoxin protein [Friedmanniella luteola]